MNHKDAERDTSSVSESTTVRGYMMLANSPVVGRWVKRVLLVVTILAVGSMVVVLAVTPRRAAVESAAVAPADGAGMRRSMDAYAARYAGLAQHYTGAEAAAERAMSAYAARYSGMAEHFASTSASLRRGRAAYAARYTGMAEHRSGTANSSKRGMDAYAARCTCLAEHYLEHGK